MGIGHTKEVQGKLYDGNGAKNALKKTLIGAKEGWDDYVMRLFEIAEGGNSPKHTHPWPHIAFIVKGTGVVNLEGTDHEVEEGSYAYIPANSEHQFINAGNTDLKFICIVPPEGDA
ncbi:MAG: cupin [Firmicutes bacterium HGW-Firmicutes-12]|nr:MAG: cupin [Firmicutes bacterium HGW-Firmicutes-12]